MGQQCSLGQSRSVLRMDERLHQRTPKLLAVNQLHRGNPPSERGTHCARITSVLSKSPCVTRMAVACIGGDKVSLGSGFGGSVDALRASTVRHPWYAVQVRSRYEVGVARYLRGMGFEEFLPLYESRKRWSDRTKVVQEPLFPGYLFCRFDLQNRLPILKTPGVIQVVGYNRQPIPVDEGEVESIQTLVTSGIPNQPWPFLKVGEKVRIESGPLRGLEGVLVEFKGNRRLILSVSLLQRSVAVEMDAAFVRSERTPAVPRLESASIQPRTLLLAGNH